jgi:hypothetical protein
MIHLTQVALQKRKFHEQYVRLMEDDSIEDVLSNPFVTRLREVCNNHNWSQEDLLELTKPEPHLYGDEGDLRAIACQLPKIRTNKVNDVAVYEGKPISSGTRLINIALLTIRFGL